MVRLGVGATVIALAFGISGCGGGNSSHAASPTVPVGTDTAGTDTSAPTIQPTVASSGNTMLVRAATQMYSDAYLTGDAPAAYRLLSRRCQQRIGRAPFFAEVRSAGSQYGKAIPFATITVDVQGDLARFSYTYKDVPAVNQTGQPWVWRTAIGTTIPAEWDGRYSSRRELTAA